MTTSRALTLGTLLTNLRGELRMSQGPALGANMRDTLVWALQRTQRELWEQHLWPFLRTDEQITVVANTSRYTVNTVDPARIVRVFQREATGDDWVPVLAHDNPSEILAFDTDSVPADEPLRWWTELEPVSNIEQLVIWPKPTRSYQLLVRGQRPLRPFVEEGHFSTLDGTLLVMAAALEFIADDKKGSLQSKQARVSAYLGRLLGQQRGGRRAGPIMLGKSDAGARWLRRGLDYM